MSCSDPDLLKVIYFLKLVISVLKIVIPVGLILICTIKIAQLVFGSIENFSTSIKGLINNALAAVIVFIAPTIVGIIMNIVGSTGAVACFNDVTPAYVQQQYIAYAEDAMEKAETELTGAALATANKYIYNITDENIKAALQVRADVVRQTIADANHNSSDEPQISDEDITTTGCYKQITLVKKGVYQYSEPDPALAILLWPNLLSINNFSCSKDKSSSKSLGSWPKSSVSSQLTNYKTYNSNFIWPTTPENSKYIFAYEHYGIDILTTFGTPIYSPVDGTLRYSEWGHTKNKDSDETAYTVSITLDKAIKYSGVSISNIFMTHMSGIRYRCNPCNMSVKKGQLLGYVGNATGAPGDVGWAPHLHMSFCADTSCDRDSSRHLMTSKMESLYQIKSGQVRKAGE